MEISNFINILKLNKMHKKKKFKIKCNNNNIIKLIKIFIKINIIKFYKLSNKKIYNIYLNSFNIRIKNLLKPSKKIFINKSIIKKSIFKKQFFLVLTNKGIISNLEAFKIGIGGVLLMFIKNK